MMEDAQHKSMKALFYECVASNWYIARISRKVATVLLPHEKIIS